MAMLNEMITEGFPTTVLQQRISIHEHFSQHGGLHRHTWYKDSLGWTSQIDICIVPVDLFR